MTDAVTLIPVFLLGMLLGGFFFGGLWWTVQHGLTSKFPAVWFLGSMLLRTGGTLVGFYLVSRDDWRKLAVCLIGFVVTRLIVSSWIKRTWVLETIRSGRERCDAD